MASLRHTLKRFASYAQMATVTLLLRRKRPYLFVLLINDTCNLNCFYCTSKNTGWFNMDAAIVGASLAAAYQRGHRALAITGGEPTLWRSGVMTIADVVAEARRVGFLDVSMFTNGTMPLRCGASLYFVSVDGTRDLHNTIRGGSYDEMLAHVRQADARAIASITVTRANAASLEETIKSIADTGAFSAITFNLLTHNPEVVRKHGFTGPDRTAVLDRLWALRQQGYPLILSRAGYRALRTNKWKRPIRQIELGTKDRVFTCCRDVDNPAVCGNCGYAGCVEMAQAIAGHPSALLALFEAL